MANFLLVCSARFCYCLGCLQLASEGTQKTFVFACSPATKQRCHVNNISSNHLNDGFVSTFSEVVSFKKAEFLA